MTTMIVCVAFMVAYPYLSKNIPPSYKRESPEVDAFWQRKANPEQGYQLVLLGDSRTYRGLSPEEMNMALGGSEGVKIINLGFSSGGLNKNIYELGEYALRGGAKPSIVILGINPWTLVPLSAQNRQYEEEKSRSYAQQVERRYLAPFTSAWQGVDLTHLLDKGLPSDGSPQVQYISNFSQSGWASSRKVPADTGESVRSYIDVYPRYQVSDSLLKELEEGIRNYTSKGIKVYAYRPPTSRGMWHFENKNSGYDEALIEKVVKQAGGKWLSLEAGAYYSYDGSHLSDTSSLRFSRWMGMRLKEDLVKSSR